MPLIATRGAASAQGFGEFAQSAAVNYIEDVFSTYLYTGTGATQTITNNIDLSTKGGLVWIKARSGAAASHALWDTARGTSNALASNLTQGNIAWTGSFSSFNTTGFTVGSDPNLVTNASGVNFASWTFRKQAKFFDIVTYTGTGSVQNIAHNLGSTPGCIIVKSTSNVSNWVVYHRSTGATQRGVLNSTTGFGANSGMWNDTAPTSTQFTVGTGDTNTSGYTFVAYLFAHNAGGFGLTGTDNVISCGSATCSGGIATINLGYEPQWILAKQTNTTGDWRMIDNMRGWTNNSSGNQTGLQANTSAAEATYGWGDTLSPTGCNLYGGASDTFIYIAIRRGPMKTPTSGTSVFANLARTGSGADATITGLTNPVDLVIDQSRDGGSVNFAFDRLRGNNLWITPGNSTSETGGLDRLKFDVQDGYYLFARNPNQSSVNYIFWNFKRAPSFFDVVCYTGNATARNVTHNLGVVPELVITANRSGINQWVTYCANVCTTNGQYLQLRLTDAKTNSVSAMWGTPYTSAPNMTATTFSLGTDAYTNLNGDNFVAYLFATCAGVSKVGSYTGTGTTKQIDCGFTGGARFVLIKRTDSTGDWYVWDTARGIVSGNDPYLLLNDYNAAEVTNTDYVDTYSAGFEISSTAPAAINASGGTFIFLAIA